MEENEETQKLFRAVKFGKSKEVKQLLENDASLLNSVDSKANTLLHMAAKNGHKNIVKELLRRAIDTEAANEDGKVAWELALQYNFKPLAVYIREKMQLPPLDGEGGTDDGEAMTSSRPQDGLDVLSELTGDDVGRAEGVGSPQAMPALQPSAVQAASPGPVDVQSHGPVTTSPGSDRRALEERAALEAVVKTLWGRFGVLAGGSRAVKNNARLEEELRALKVRFGGGGVGDVESVLSERDDLVKRAAEHEREAEKQKQRIERLEEDVGYTREARERAEEERNEAVQRARAERQSKDEAEREARRAREEAEDGRAELERARSEVRATQQQVQGLKGGLKTTLKEMHVPGLTPAELQALFEKHDRDRSGEISPEELRGLVRELGEVFDSRVQDAREEARAATVRADTAEQDRKRHVDRAREELAEQTKQVKQLREELAAADEARRTALAEAQRRADAARQEMQKRLDKAAKEHEMVLKKMVEEHNAETTRAEEQAKKEAAEAKKAHAKEAKELQKRAADAEKDVEMERAQRKVAEARQHEAQAALEEARAALHRAALLEAASKSQTCLSQLFALRGRLRETSAAFRDARRAAAEHADGVRGGFREIREALAGYVTFILPLAHERPENVRTERLSPAQLGQALRHMMGKYRGAAERCRALNAEMQGLKGAMRVYCRVRPLRDAEAADGASIHLRGLGELSVLAKAGGTREYRFDTAYGPRASQEEVFADARPLLQTAVDGYNVSVFAYGPTGSGKTYTMTGDRASRRHRGLVYRMLEDVFATQKERATLADMEVRLSMFEIYNEAVRDLLAPGAHERAGWEDGAAREGASLKVSTDKRGNVHVEGLTEHRVDGLQRGLALVEYGQEVRATGATNLNEHSSRSHLLIRLGVRTVDRRTGARAVGKMYLIDLAGSENVQQSGAAGKQLKEAIGINKSAPTYLRPPPSRCPCCVGVVLSIGARAQVARRAARRDAGAVVQGRACAVPQLAAHARARGLARRDCDVPHVRDGFAGDARARHHAGRAQVRGALQVDRAGARAESDRRERGARGGQGARGGRGAAGAARGGAGQGEGGGGARGALEGDHPRGRPLRGQAPRDVWLRGTRAAAPPAATGPQGARRRRPRAQEGRGAIP